MAYLEVLQKYDDFRDALKKKLDREPTDSEVMLAAIQASDPVVPVQSSPDDQFSLKEATLEEKDVSGWFPPKRRELLDWFMRFLLKPILFVVVLMGSAWWVWDVSQMVWQAGRSNSGFHLSDSVLIALITTSVANFLALVTIIANNLFPNTNKSGDSK